VNAVTELLGWIGFAIDHVWVLGVAAAAIAVGWGAGFLGAVSLGWRGRLYGAMVGGMIVNAVAKLEEASYRTAFLLMAMLTVVTFLLGHRRRGN
jgi:hypothetical protein